MARGAIVVLRKRAFCVYTHEYAGEVFYVGMGIASRPCQWLSRNSVWLAKTSTLDEFTVTIVEWFERRADAMRAESELINKMQPSCNVQRPNEPTDDQLFYDDPIALINKAELARQLKVSRETVSSWFRSKPPSVPEPWRAKVSKATGIPEDELPGANQ